MTDVVLERLDQATLRHVRGLHRAVAACLGRDPAVPLVPTLELTSHELDAAVATWRDLVPAEPDLRAALLRRVLDRSGLPDGPTANALGAFRPDVAAAYRAAYGSDLDRDRATAPVAVPRRDVADGSGLDEVRLLALERAFAPVRLEAGQVLFRAGDPGDSLYVVSSGRVRVVVGAGPDERTVRELAPGEMVGEAALLTGEARSATIVAVRDSELHRIDTDGVERHLFGDPAALRTVVAAVARRLQRGGPLPVGSGVRNIALVPVGGGRAGPGLLAAALAALLARYGTRAVALTAADVPPDLTGAGEVAGWLSEQEEAADLVLCVAGADADTWARRALRSADLVLLVAEAGAEVGDGPVERLVPPGTRRELVVLHPSALVPPAGTRRWLAGRSVARVHHVVVGESAHVARLARLLLGRPVALVLSGGSVRGFAHIGVLRALREQAIPVDVVCGTSAGALLGAQYAMGWDDRELERRNLALFAGRRRRLLDWTLPVSSVLGGVGLNAVLDEVFGDLRIEDLWLPYLCTTSDLTAAELLTHTDGPLRQWVRASCSVPVLLPPVVVDGHLLADGGVLNNLPVAPLLAHTDVGTLVVVNVTSPFYAADEAYDYLDALPLRRLVRSRLPGGSRLVTPAIAKVLLRSLEIGTKSQEREQIARADVYVRPEVDDAAYTDLDRMPELVRAGYDATVRALAGWDASGIPFR